MSITNITLNGNTVALVSVPASPGFSDIQFNFTDIVGSVRAPFTGITQTQPWVGADYWMATATLPPLHECDADAWTSMLAEMRGITNPILVADPMRLTPRGNPSGAPVANTAGGTGWNAAATTTLFSRGWTPSKYRLLLPGTNIQIGYRLHRVLDQVNSDANGDAAISIWPSLREVPADGTPITLSNPSGLFRLAKNQRGWQTSVESLTTMSLNLTEYR